MYDDKQQSRGTGGAGTGTGAGTAGANAPGKQTRVEMIDVGVGPQADPARQQTATQAVQALAQRFGRPVDGVRVHADAGGDQRARSRGAVAFAEGHDIFLALSVDPSGAEGRRILAHELVHVVQQTDPAPAPPGAPADRAAFEREAHELGDRIAAGGTAAPKLRTGGAVAQAFGSPEHQDMGNRVHDILEPQAQKGDQALFGGVTHTERAEQTRNEQAGKGVAHGAHAAEGEPGSVAVPELAEMLARDRFIDGARDQKLSLRNFNMARDAAGPYLAMEIDRSTKEPARYDVPVSLGDLTAMTGDLYSSMANLRLAPTWEVTALQRTVDAEAAFERQVAAGKADPKHPPNFDMQYEQATEWRKHPVFVAGQQVGTGGEAAGGDHDSYLDMAKQNQAHFGEDSTQQHGLEVRVNADPGAVAALAGGAQGNAADGNERAWLDGHARALGYAREAYQLMTNPQPGPAVRVHEATPDTGLEDAYQGRTGLKQNSIIGVDGKVMSRTASEVTVASKSNDAYLENAGADHYLTDAFAAGHQIVRSTVGQIADKFAKDHGGIDKFLDKIVEVVQHGAHADAERPEPEGDLQDLWSYSRGVRGFVFGWAARSKLKAKLKEQLGDPQALHGIGAKVVHDYYNTRGMIVHNRKGMTFMIKGDDHASEAPEARQIIALAVLASRDQITQVKDTGASVNPMDVWAYTPDPGHTQLTLANGSQIMEIMFADTKYLWEMIKKNFTLLQAPDTHQEQASSKYSHQEQKLAKGKVPVDVGTTPMKSYFAKRHQYVQDVANKHLPNKGAALQTADGINTPGLG
jgi:hypothetical protein